MDNHNIELLAGIVGNQAHSAKEAKGTIKYLERVRDEFIKSKSEMKREISRLREVVGNRNNREAELESEMEKLKAENVKLDDALWSISNRCDDTKTSDNGMDASGRVEWLASAYIEEKAKASKLNAEKLAYMRIVNQELSVSLEKRHLLANITSQYKEWLAGRGKK